MARLQVFWLAACVIGLVLVQAADAADPPAAPISAVTDDMPSDRHDRARELIRKRAIQEARARMKRMADRKRFGISLLRPVHSTAQQSSMSPFNRIDRGIRLDR
jgi:hypothetical protein